MKEDHQPCVTQTCRFDPISHPSSSFKKELNFSWYFLKFWTEQSFLRTYRSSVLDRAKICSGEKVTVQKGTHFFTDDKVSPSLTIFHLPFLSLQNTTRLKSGVTFTCFFLLSLKPFFVWANLLREATLRTLISWNLSFCVHSCSLCEKINAEFSVNIVWGNSRKATSASVSERS